MKKPLSHHLAGRHGFTLAEVLIAMTIFGIASVGIISFLFQGTKIYYRDRAALMINRDIRSLTAQLDTDAVTSNYFRIYTTFGNWVDSSSNDLAVRDGQVGDFVVFAFTDPATGSAATNKINQIVCYYREITDSTLNTGPVHRINLIISPSVQATNVGTLLSQKITGSASSYPIVTQIAQGLAADTNTGASTPITKLFYNYKNRSVMIAAQIAESLNEIQLSTSQLGNTYNFSVSPRG